MANTQKDNVTGLDFAPNREDAEYDLVTSLLEAADYKTASDRITEVEIKRDGKYLFTVHVHPISEADMRFARKKAAIYMANPQGKKYPPIEKDTDNALFGSWCIYLASTEEDQQKIWGNPAIMQKFNLQQPVDSIDILLYAGEKRKLGDIVMEISGMDDEEEEESTSDEEYAKN